MMKIRIEEAWLRSESSQFLRCWCPPHHFSSAKPIVSPRRRGRYFRHRLVPTGCELGCELG